MRVVYRDDEIDRINGLIAYHLQADQKELKFDVKHIVKDPKFQRAIENARAKLGLGPEDYLDDETELDNWIISKLAGKDSDEASKDEQQAYYQQFTDTSIQACDEANLPAGWIDFMSAYIALGDLPQYADIEPDYLIRAEEFSPDGQSIILSLEKGLKPEDYKKAWKAFKEFLRQPNGYKPTEGTLKDKIYLDSRRGMTPTQIAKKYFPKEYERDRKNGADSTRQKVKKIIARYKRPE